MFVACWSAQLVSTPMIGRVLSCGSDVVFTSLPGPAEFTEVTVGERGLLDGMKQGAVLFDLTTNSPTVVREVHADLVHGLRDFRMHTRAGIRTRGDRPGLRSVGEHVEPGGRHLGPAGVMDACEQDGVHEADGSDRRTTRW